MAKAKPLSQEETDRFVAFLEEESHSDLIERILDLTNENVDALQGLREYFYDVDNNEAREEDND